jgi:tetratricopeptide (TPR) repeat protein
MSDPESASRGASIARAERIVPGSRVAALANGFAIVAEHPEAALKQAEILLRAAPERGALRLKAAACRGLGKAKEAESAELHAIQIGFADRELEAAAVAQGDGRRREAKLITDKYLKREPDDLLALVLNAEAAMELWNAERTEDLNEVEATLRRILSRAPSFLRANMLLATCLMKQVRMREAIALLEETRGRKPDNREVLALLVRARVEVGDVDEAIILYEKLALLDPSRPEMWVNLGQYYRIAGRGEDAIGAFRSALRADPGNGSAWWSLANYFGDHLSEIDERNISQALLDRSEAIDAGPLHLALGLLHDRRGDHAEAFAHFASGKAARLAKQSFDPDAISAAVDDVVRTFTLAFYKRRKSAGWADESPIFILGMPRSGTTLVERILGQHSAVEVTGELQIIPRLADIARFQAGDSSRYAALLEGLTDEQLSEIGQNYVTASLNYRTASTAHFIDKNNLNWMHIGTILLALPNAKIIDVRRNAVDCCWANFKMLFGAFPAANDLRHVGRFYCDYVRLMDAIKAVAADRILTVPYENVVDDLESQAQQMTTFLGLRYERGMKDFHLSEKPVATASSEQVRQPINRRGIGSAEPYRSWLAPLIDTLGPLAAV